MESSPSVCRVYGSVVLSTFALLCNRFLELSHGTSETAAISLSDSPGRGLCLTVLTSTPRQWATCFPRWQAQWSRIPQQGRLGKAGVSFLRDWSILCRLVPGPAEAGAWHLGPHSSPASGSLPAVGSPSVPTRGRGQGCGSRVDSGLCGACPLSGEVCLWENLQMGCPLPHAHPGPHSEASKQVFIQ